MEVVNLSEKISEAGAKDEGATKVDIYGTDKFRSWILYFLPGEGTDMHFHVSPETFLVVQGSGVVKGKSGPEREIRERDVICLGVRDYYQITNNGREPLVLFGNRSEAFGGPHMRADGKDLRNADGTLGPLDRAAT